MPKVKSFEIEVKEAELKQKLDSLDEIVNSFLTRNNIKNVISVSDTARTDNKGETIGLIRVICYED